MGEKINIEVREAPQGSFTRVHRPLQGTSKNPGFTESTGNREVQVYTGLYADLCSMAEQLYAANGGATDSGSVQRTYDVRQTQGEMGELTITNEHYRRPRQENDDDDGGTDDEEDDYGDDPGSSPDYPEISVQCNTVEEPLMLHPKFKGAMTGDVAIGVHAMINGASEGSMIEMADGSLKRVGELVKGAGDILKFIRMGVTHYLAPHTVVTIRHKGHSGGGTVGQIGHVSGLPAAGKGMRWLCVGTGREKCGPEVYTTSVWECGNWDTSLYD